MDRLQALARRQQRIEALCAASIRALTGDADLHYRGRRLHRGERRLPSFGPHLHPAVESDDLASFRGAADGIALRLLLSDEGLHRRLRPQDPLEGWVFELLEQFRVESMVPPSLPGMAANLRHRFERWSEAFRASGLTEDDAGLLLFTIAQMCRSRVTGLPPAHASEETIEATRAGIAPVIGAALAGLRRHRADQAAYAGPALEIARQVAQALRGRDPRAAAALAARDEASPDGAPRFSLWMDLDGEGDAAPAAGLPSGAAGAPAVPAQDDYRVFTRAYDRELPAASLVRAQRLLEHRARLDRLQAQGGPDPARVARILGAALLRADHEVPEDGREEGLVDGRRVAMLVSSPAERRLFRWHRQEPRGDCVLSLLVDCSGSMKPHRETVARFADLLLRALDALGVGSELLGFTTGAWNGGRALRDWRRAGRPPAPGRLAEREHLVFKAAGQPWRRARAQVAALLEPAFYREGVDGEAVEWACARLAGCDARRRVLLVLSDGCPMESASAAANPPGLLEAHLRAVVSAQRRRGAVEILGLGVGLDLSPYYDRSLLLDPQAPLSQATFVALARALAG